jgi:FkbM family methyltransferase
MPVVEQGRSVVGSVSSLARRVRRLGLSLLPSRSRAMLRRLHESLTTPTSRVAGACTEDDGSVVVVMRPPAPSFRIVPESRPGVEDHLRNPRQAAELAAFVREARQPGVLFDVGANEGLFSILYCLGHPANRAVAFEPSFPLCQRISRNTRLNALIDRQRVVDKAVGDVSGHRQMVVNEGEQYVQVRPYRGRDGPQWQERSIATTTLDIECESIRPSLLKIDVEGYEWEVLRGARGLLGAGRPVVFLELHLNFLEERGISPSAVLNLLVAGKYELFALGGRAVSIEQICRSWASVLHVIARPAR